MCAIIRRMDIQIRVGIEYLTSNQCEFHPGRFYTLLSIGFIHTGEIARWLAIRQSFNQVDAFTSRILTRTFLDHFHLKPTHLQTGVYSSVEIDNSFGMYVWWSSYTVYKSRHE